MGIVENMCSFLRGCNVVALTVWSVVAEARNPAGRSARAWLQTPEGYTLTALTSLEIAKRALPGEVEKGRPPSCLALTSFSASKRCAAATTTLEEPVAALVCLGYPLVGMGQAVTLRDRVLVGE